MPLDPWGHPYVYEPPADAARAPRVHSLGSDGKPGGEGLAADIYNNSGTWVVDGRSRLFSFVPEGRAPEGRLPRRSRSPIVLAIM